MTELDHTSPHLEQADADTISNILRAFETANSDVMPLLDEALNRFPDDGRLQFFKGAYLASLGDSEVARPAFIACITRLPAFYPGWFMLGFLELMNGRVEDAQTAWAVLDALPPEDSLRLCADGLLLLAHDEFEHAARQLELALAKNTLYPPLNAYIRSVLKAVHERGFDPTPLSPEHHLLLAGYVSSMTRH